MEVPVEWAEREPVPIWSRVGELGDLLAKCPQGDDLTLRSQPDSVETPPFVAEVQIVSLIEDDKLLVLTQIKRPLRGLGSASPMVLVVEEVTEASSPCRNGVEMTAFTAD